MHFWHIRICPPCYQSILQALGACFQESVVVEVKLGQGGPTAGGNGVGDRQSALRLRARAAEPQVRQVSELRVLQHGRDGFGAARATHVVEEVKLGQRALGLEDQVAQLGRARFADAVVHGLVSKITKKNVGSVLD